MVVIELWAEAGFTGAFKYDCSGVDRFCLLCPRVSPRPPREVPVPRIFGVPGMPLIALRFASFWSRSFVKVSEKACADGLASSCSVDGSEYLRFLS